jgi:O-methyltransferase/aklanonic acid methyltransferase
MPSGRRSASPAGVLRLAGIRTLKAKVGNSPDRRTVAGVFGRSAASYDSVIPFFGTFGRLLVDAAALRPGERVLDLACGRGACALPA